MTNPTKGRRGFLQRMLAAGGLASAAQAQSGAPQKNSDSKLLPPYARQQHYKSLKQSSFDRTGGNHDYWNIPAGGMQEVFNTTGPGVISHIWFTIAARSG